MDRELHLDSQNFANAFMEAYPMHSRLSSNYNSLHDLLKRTLLPMHYSAEMHVPMGDSLVTFGVKVLKDGQVTIDHDHVKHRDLNPETAMENNYRKEIDFTVRFYTLQRKDIKSPLTPYVINAADGFIFDRVIPLPISNGCMYSVSDGDGIGGMFMKNGREFFFQHTFIDCPNNMFCIKYASGVHRVLYQSRPLSEVSAYKDNRYSANIVLNQIAIIPNEGIFIQVSMSEKYANKTEHSSGDSRTTAFIPLMLYVDILQWKVEGKPFEGSNIPEVKHLFEGIKSLERLIKDPKDRSDFSAFVDNTYSTTLNYYANVEGKDRNKERMIETEMLAGECFPWLKPNFVFKTKNEVIVDTPVERELRKRMVVLQAMNDVFPHITATTFGSFSKPDTKLGFLKKMVVRGFASIAGLMKPHDQGDIRNYRIKTAEMEVANKVKAILYQTIHTTLIHKINEEKSTLNRRLWIENQCVKVIEKSLKMNTDVFVKRILSVNTNGKSAKSFELGTDIRKCILNYLEKLHLMKITTTASADPNKRRMHPSYAGHLCGSDTPTNASVGLELNPNLSTLVSYDINPFHILEEIKPLFIEGPGVGVYLNGILQGTCRDAEEMRSFIRAKRRSVVEEVDAKTGTIRRNLYFLPLGVHTGNELVQSANGSFHVKKCIFIRCDAGRLYKPAVNVKAYVPGCGNEKLFHKLVEDGFIEFMDLEEELSHDVKYCTSLWECKDIHTHCELHPCLMHGVLSSLIPHVNRNHGVKNSNMCNHFKAIMHTYSLMYATRLDTISYVAWNLQVPVNRTAAFDWLELHHRPHGANVLVMIASHNGYDQEDAIIVKESFIERGGFYSIVSKNFDAKELIMPSQNTRRLHVSVGDSFIENAKLATYTTTNNQEKEIRAGPQETGRIDYINNTSARLNLRSYRSVVAKVGDKFCTSHAQKGTVGLIVSEMDLPYTEDGLTPDILINPHAIPSRTTVAQIVEILFGSAAAASAEFRREFAFDETPLDTIENILKKFGIEKNGTVKVIDPITGQRVKGEVYMGTGYYCRLKHIVDDKIRSVDIIGGKKDPNTRQYVEGRKNRGGIKIGEMERDGIGGHGGAFVLHECFTHFSDGMPLYIDTDSHGISPIPQDASASVRKIESNYTVLKVDNILNASMMGLKFETIV